jgi:hypothetical protein
VIRLAGALILLGLLPAVHVLLDTSGPTSIPFTFFGTPAVAAGIALYLLARWQEAGSSR